ncbi:MAG TPA: uroporphyrinogen decarboxylase family protein [Bacteroidota bacterium]|nr:uroporphyrinogen decarboxylase family protein [Bacteroidota bacterium]
MTEQQWNTLKNVIAGKNVSPLPVGFIIDSPWLPNWCGKTFIDYFSNDQTWLEANLKVVQTFPEVMFLPGFWSEYGMCTEPSSFGVRCHFPQNEFPYPFKIIDSTDDIDSLITPDPSTDGLLPFVLNRLKLARPAIEDAGHSIRFAVARGPLNIASYLMGSTEFLTTMMMMPDKAHTLMKKITTFLKNWLQLQAETFPTIDGIFLLDDIIGFMGEPEFREFGLPYFQELYSLPVTVKFLHNDAQCRVSAPILPEMGVNLFNMGFDIPLKELQQITQKKVTLLGNLPPRDVLAAATPQGVYEATTAMLKALDDTSHLIVSCGGGMPPGVTTENIKSFVEAVKNFKH